MTSPEIAPYGSWDSPISSDLIVSGGLGLGQIMLDGENVYWAEGRPSENGRNAIVKWSPKNGVEEMLPAGFNARSRVHEYGGGAFTVHDDVLYFTNFVDQRLYRQRPRQEPEPLTPPDGMRYADMLVDAPRQRLICIREAHDGAGEAVNTLVAVSLENGEDAGTVLASGHDFYASPRLSPDGRQLAWISWNHPNMPWDGTELWLAQIDDNGSLTGAKKVVGGAAESIFQPEWSPDGTLYFVSDRTDWWNLYRLRADGGVEPLYPLDAEFGLPQWVFGMTTYGFADDRTIICSYTQNGRSHLAKLDTENGRFTPIPLPYATISARSSLKVGAGHVLFAAAAADKPTAIIRLNLATETRQILREATNISLPDGVISRPEAIEFPTEHGRTAHAFFYPPRNDAYQPPAGENPPIIVISHGGPTSATTISLNPSIQYWTSRGIGVVDVNYGGSTGYGREYRQRLNGEWGIVDTEDCINAARYLVENGRADGERLVIMGGSAGGYTTLCALTFHDVFGAGISLFGISDIELMAKETHKFESRYIDSMIGSYPEAKAVYEARSPIHFIDQLNCPLLLFQGLEDRVVPPNQAELMFEALKAKGVPVAYVAYPGEGHGFRQAENIKRTLDGSLYFLSKVFGFDLPVPVEPVAIENL